MRIARGTHAGTVRCTYSGARIWVIDGEREKENMGTGYYLVSYIPAQGHVFCNTPGCTHSTGPAPKSTSPKEAVDLRLRKRRSGLCREGTLVASSSSSVSAR